MAGQSRFLTISPASCGVFKKSRFLERLERFFPKIGTVPPKAPYSRHKSCRVSGPGLASRRKCGRWEKQWVRLGTTLHVQGVLGSSTGRPAERRPAPPRAAAGEAGGTGAWAESQEWTPSSDGPSQRHRSTGSPPSPRSSLHRRARPATSHTPGKLPSAHMGTLRPAEETRRHSWLWLTD